MWGPIFRFFQTKQPGSIWRSPRWIPEGGDPAQVLYQLGIDVAQSLLVAES